MRDRYMVKRLMENHYLYTKSAKAKRILDNWQEEVQKRLRRGPRYVRQDIQVTLAPSVSRRVIPFAATVLRSGTTTSLSLARAFAQ